MPLHSSLGDKSETPQNTKNNPNEESLSDLFMERHQANQYAHYGTSKRKREARTKPFEEIITKNFPNLRKTMDMHI